MESLRSPALSKDAILAAFSSLNEKFEAEGVIGEVCLFGGTVMLLVFNARLSTRDVDAVFSPPEIFRKCSVAVARERELPDDWLNDGVKGFLSERGTLTTEGVPQFSHLRVARPTAEYLLAMKCMAARAPGYDTQGDRRDIAFLIRHLGIQNAADALALVEKYYAPERIQAKTQFMIVEVFDQMKMLEGGAD